MTTVPHDETLVKVLSRGDQTTIGEYRVTVDSDRWWWSDVVYRMHGFEPGEVVPTLGRGPCDEDGSVTGVTGYMLDLAGSVRHLASQEATASIEAEAPSREAILDFIVSLEGHDITETR